MGSFLALIIVLLPLAASVYGIYRIYRAIKEPVSLYSFGKKELETISAAIKKKDFTGAGQLLCHLSPDDLTQAVDHISASCTTDILLVYLKHSGNDPVSSLLYGARNLYLAWKVRGHSATAELSKKKFSRYVEFLREAAVHLENASKDKRLAAEAHSRLIRVYMSLGYEDQAKAHFGLAVKSAPSHLWAHIHYAELIQPKWYGTIEDVKAFMKDLPQDFMIRTIITLKLFYDSISDRVNYFNIEPEDIESFAEKLLHSYNDALEMEKPSSIHVYVIYGYMYLLSTYVGNKQLAAKYKKLTGRNLALYPFGLM